MATLTLTLPDELKEAVEAQAAAAGFADVGEYVAEMLRSDVIGAPAHLRVESDEQLEALLLTRVDGPFVETGPEDFARMRDELEAALAPRVESAK